MEITNSNVTINVKAIDKSIAFYEKLGFTLKQRWGNHYAQLSGPNLIIGLHPTKDENLKSGSGNLSIGFTTNNFEASKKELEDSGLQFTFRKEQGGSFLHFQDPDGTSLYIIDPKN